AARITDRLAGVARLELRQRLERALERVGQPTQQHRTVRRRDRPPRTERGLRTRDRRVGLLDTRGRQLAKDLLGRGLEDRRHRVAARMWSRTSSTNVPMTWLVWSSSGCHSTPSAKLRAGSSIASTFASSLPQPVGSTPPPSWPGPWWWCDFTDVRSLPTT